MSGAAGLWRGGGHSAGSSSTASGGCIVKEPNNDATSFIIGNAPLYSILLPICPH